MRDAYEPTGFRSRQKLSSSRSLGHITRVAIYDCAFPFFLSFSLFFIFTFPLLDKRDNVSRSIRKRCQEPCTRCSLSLSLFACLRLSVHRDLFLNFTVDAVIVGALFVEGRRPVGHRNESKPEVFSPVGQLYFTRQGSLHPSPCIVHSNPRPRINRCDTDHAEI